MGSLWVANPTPSAWICLPPAAVHLHQSVVDESEVVLAAAAARLAALARVLLVIAAGLARVVVVAAAAASHHLIRVQDVARVAHVLAARLAGHTAALAG